MRTACSTRKLRQIKKADMISMLPETMRSQPIARNS